MQPSNLNIYDKRPYFHERVGEKLACNRMQNHHREMKSHRKNHKQAKHKITSLISELLIFITYR